MDSPLIGVTGNARRWSPSWWCIRTALYLVGARPHRISVLNPDIPRDLDGMIISGGDDIHPALYADEEAGAEMDEFDPERDQLEIACINHAKTHEQPLLGICRGAQLINVVHGGNLHQDVNPLRSITSRRAHLLPWKSVDLAADSRISQETRRCRLRVNSLHDQAINRVGSGLTVSGRDRDGIVQAIESSSQVMGVQWHPEYLLPLPTQLRIFRWLKHQAQGG